MPYTMQVPVVEHRGPVKRYAVFPEGSPLYDYYFVYVLELEDNHVYVGRTSQPGNRLRDLFNQDNYAPKFVKAYRPICLLECVYVYGYHAAEHRKNNWTTWYSRSYGVTRVRGGRFVALTPNDEWIRQQEIQAHNSAGVMANWYDTKSDRNVTLHRDYY